MARHLLVCLALVAGARPAVAQPGAPQASGPTAAHQPAELRGLGIVQRLDAQVPPDLIFRAADGQTQRLGEFFRRKPLVLALVYFECPMLCSQVLNGLVRSLRALSLEVGRDFEVLAVSFDPGETPALAAAKKARYVSEYGREDSTDGWHFLTGDQANIARLTGTVGFRYRYDKATAQFIHPAAAILLTKDGRVARYLYGIDFAPRDLRLGLIEASAGEIGSPIDQALLFCYRYDPATGRYSLIVLNLIRAGGVVTLLVLGAFVLIALRRERNQDARPRVDARRQCDGRPRANDP